MAKNDLITRNLMLDSLRQYAKNRISFNLLREHDAKNKIPLDILKEMYDHDILGVHLLLIPEEYGGLGGQTTEIYRVCEQLARIDLGIATGVFATFLGSDPLNVGGTPEQKAKWFKKIAQENKLVAYGATEADAGSDLVSLRTRAERVTQDGRIVGYKITGSKMWISNGGVADIYTVLALAPDGPSWFIVERGTPGFTQDAHEDKHGIRLSNTAGLSFDEVYVPAENLIGLKEGQGFLQAQAVFGYTRLMVAAFGLGGGEEAAETALEYAQQRIQAGGPLAQKQGFMLKLITPHFVRFEAARAYIDWTAKQLEVNNHGLATEGAIAKLYTTEEGNKAAEDAIQAMGGFGYTKEFAVEKIERDVKITCIYEGTSEVLEMTIFRGRWQEHLKSRGQYYLSQAAEFDTLHTQNPDVGADSVALGLRALARVLEECRINKLTRHQYVTFMLGDLISEMEVAAVFTRECAAKHVTEGSRFDLTSLCTMARINARQSAFKTASEGLRLILGTCPAADTAALAQAVNLVGIEDKMRGLIDDMDSVSAKLRDIFKK